MLPLQLDILLAEPRHRQHQHDEAVGHRAGGVAELRQFVGDEDQPRREFSGPLLPVFDVDGQKVFARDRQQALDHDAAVAAGEPRVGDYRQASCRSAAPGRNRRPRLDSVGAATFFGPIRAPRIRAISPLPARVGPTISSIFCRSSRPADHVAEPLCERLADSESLRPQALEELAPHARHRRLRVVVERHRHDVEEVRVVRQQLARLHVQQPVRTGDDGSGRPAVEPGRLIHVGGEQA